MTAPALPDVSTSTAGTVVVELDPSHAEVLARVLYAYEALSATIAGPHGAEAVEEYDAGVWDPVALALLGEATTVRVPLIPATSWDAAITKTARRDPGDRRFRVVKGDQG